MFFNNTSTLRALSKLRTWTGTFTVHRLHDKEKNKIYFQHLVYMGSYKFDISAKGEGLGAGVIVSPNKHKKLTMTTFQTYLGETKYACKPEPTQKSGYLGVQDRQTDSRAGPSARPQLQELPRESSLSQNSRRELCLEFWVPTSAFLPVPAATCMHTQGGIIALSSAP